MPKPCEKVREKRDDMVQDILLFSCYNVVLPWQITHYARDFFHVVGTDTKFVNKIPQVNNETRSDTWNIKLLDFLLTLPNSLFISKFLSIHCDILMWRIQIFYINNNILLHVPSYYIAPNIAILQKNKLYYI